MPGLLDLSFMQGQQSQPQATPVAGFAPPPQQPGQNPATMLAALPPGLLQMLQQKLMGGMGGGVPPPGGGAMQPPTPGGNTWDMLPGALNAGATPDQVAAGAGAMPPGADVATVLRMVQAKNTATEAPPDAMEQGYVRGMKKLLAKGLVSQEEFDRQINNPKQYTHGGR